MSTVEMEVFSNTQLIIMTVLMLLGGEVLTSILGLYLSSFKISKPETKESRVSSVCQNPPKHTSFPGLEIEKPINVDVECNINSLDDDHSLKPNSIKFLAWVALGYFSVVHITASTFSNCGFVPTNENMVAFKKNSGLLLILIPQILLGNTEMGYGHLLSFSHSCLLAVTVLGFILVEFIIFCSMEWSSGALDGLNSNQKLIGALFQVVNSRHTGESVVDLSIISPAILVLFVVMMYLPPYTSFMPVKQQVISETGQKCKNRRKSLAQCLLFSPLSILAIFVILICVSEREKLKKDPLNFNVLNITMEVVSAYGNVGFSTGYSCKRQLEPDSSCKDAWFGFVGRWSNMGKLILILVMFFGRLKKFSINGGKAWKLS
ncbi:POTASSIUM TRANSPORT PROTEIN [Salix koriyanagi]|uniref:POTASSIUM TRANSPORT PROTEIN n=1 Tax=Salix koriyanagi TaxID=2511006 RepID=A0A9Q1A5H5_9ROSI|nr:POTASSIUM TRANSPORT PROTEIN [Salix koriyanagi]